ncbi:Ltp family lipoprotein [Candidatus Peregrinibacteria bacterium]|nr:MAG: Ltp family lipoprotein [Candidatus Peregrinibacteria bacterium]
MKYEIIGDNIKALNRRVGVDSVGYTITETNCKTMQIREFGYSEESPSEIIEKPSEWYDLVLGSNKSDLAKFLCENYYKNEEKPEPTKEAAVPTEYKSALYKATMYAKTMHMSKQGVYDQIVSEYGEKFSADAAQYAIDNMTADWNANALVKAKTYQDTMNMSPSAIHDQLTSAYGEKFTKSEADYAIQHLND